MFSLNWICHIGEDTNSIQDGNLTDKQKIFFRRILSEQVKLNIATLWVISLWVDLINQTENTQNAHISIHVSRTQRIIS